MIVKYLFCYDLHDSEENRDNYVRLIETMDEKFGPMIRFTDSVYLFETRPTDLDDLRREIEKTLDFISGLEFYVFRLAREMDNVTTLKCCEAKMEWSIRKYEELLAELGNK